MDTKRVHCETESNFSLVTLATDGASGLCLVVAQCSWSH